MWAYKQNELVEADGRGNYRLTDQGTAFKEGLKGESPAATGLSGATTSDSDGEL